MPGITLKDIPSPLYNSLQQAAQNHHRSLTKEIVYALECYVQQVDTDKSALLSQIRETRNRYAVTTISDADINEWKESGRP
jgi:hypothetical protein